MKNHGVGGSMPSKNELISSMWWKLSVKERENHNHLIMVQLLSPFLFSQVFQDKKWILWCQQAKLVTKERLSSCNELTEDEHKSIDLVEDAMVKLKMEFQSSGTNGATPYRRFKEIMDDIDICVKMVDLRAAVKNIGEKQWFTSVRSTLASETIFKKEAAILLTTWLYCDYIKLLHDGRKPMTSYIANSTLDEKDERKERGKRFVSRGEYGRAVSIYSEILAEKCFNYILYGNRAQCYLKMQKFGLARDDGRRTVVLNATWEKGQYRYAQALGALGLLEKGILVLKKALPVCAENSDELHRLMCTFQSKVGGHKRMKVKKRRHFGELSAMPPLVIPSSGDESTDSQNSTEDSAKDSDNDIDTCSDFQDGVCDSAYSKSNDKDDTPPPLLESDIDEFSDENDLPWMFRQYKAKRTIKPRSRSEVRGTVERTKPGQGRQQDPKDGKARSLSVGQQLEEDEKFQKLSKSSSDQVHIASNGTGGLKSKFSSSFIKTTKGTPFEEKPPVLANVLKEGSDAFLDNRFHVAIGHYNHAITLYEKRDRTGDKTCSRESTSVLYYALGKAHIECGTSSDLGKALSQFSVVLEKYDNSFILGYYGIGMVLFKQYRFYDVRSPLTKAKDLLESHGIKEKKWPGTHIFIEESKPKVLMRLIESLMAICLFPPRPDAVCRFEQCKQLKRCIYFDDPDYRGFVRLKCSEDCNIDYHVVCWKKVKSLEFKVSLKKGPIDHLCLTPDCDGFIYIIRLYNENTREIETEFKSLKRKRPLKVGGIVDKAKRKHMSSTKRIEKLKVRKQEKELILKRKQEEESVQVIENGIRDIPEESLDENSSRSGANGKDSPTLADQHGSDLEALGTIVLKKEDDELDQLFPFNQRGKVKRKKSKVKKKQQTSIPIRPSLQVADSNLSSTNSSVISDFDLDSLQREAYDLSYGPEQRLLQYFQDVIQEHNGYVHLVQEQTWFSQVRHLGPTCREVLETYGGVRQFLEAHPCFVFDLDDPNLVYLSQDETMRCLDRPLAPVNGSDWSQRKRLEQVVDSVSENKISPWMFDIWQGHRDSVEMFADADVLRNGYTGPLPSCFSVVENNSLSAVHQENFAESSLNPNASVFVHAHSSVTDTSSEASTRRMDILSEISLPDESQDDDVIHRDVHVFGRHLCDEDSSAKNGNSPVGDVQCRGEVDVSSSVGYTKDVSALVPGGTLSHTTKAESNEEGLHLVEIGTMTDPENSTYEKLYQNECANRDVLISQMEETKDMIQQLKAKLITNTNKLEREKQEISTQNEELKKEIQKLKDQKESGARRRQLESIAHSDEIKSLQAKLKAANDSRLRELLNAKEEEIQKLTDELHDIRVKRDNEVLENEDIINKLSNCVTEQSKRAQKAEIAYMETKKQLIQAVYTPLLDQAKLSLETIRMNSFVDGAPHQEDLRLAWEQFHAALQMELRSCQKKLSDTVRQLQLGNLLEKVGEPEISLPRITPPPIPAPVFPVEPQGGIKSKTSLGNERLPKVHVAQETNDVVRNESYKADENSPKKAGSKLKSIAGNMASAEPSPVSSTGRTAQSLASTSSLQGPSDNRTVITNGDIQENCSQVSASGFHKQTNEAKSQEVLSRKKILFEKIVLKIGVRFPQLTKEQIQNHVYYFKLSRPNKSLSGLTVDDIINGVVEFIKNIDANSTGADKKEARKKQRDAIDEPQGAAYSRRDTSRNCSFAEIPSSSESRATTKVRQPTQEMSPQKEKAWGVKQPAAVRKVVETKKFGQMEPCIICHDEMKSDIITLQCGHPFHNTCIQRWFQQQSTCPTCRDHALLPEDFPPLK